MAKRAYSPKDVANIKCKALPFEGQWKDVFDQPEEGDTWFISGPSASGKSSFVMQFAKMLCGIGSVLYVSLEEGVGLSMQRRLAQFKMTDVQGSFRLITDGDIKALEERLAKPKSAKFYHCGQLPVRLRSRVGIFTDQGTDRPLQAQDFHFRQPRG